MTIRAYNKAPSPQIPGGEQEYVDRELNKLKQTTDDVISNAGTLAPIDSPVFTGTPKAPTPATADSSTLVATTAFVKSQGYLTSVSPQTMSGDVTGTTGANTIAANAVTYSKMQQVAAGKLLGNSGASAANVGELTPSQALDLIGTTRGSMLYRGASGWVVLPPGVSGQYLKTQGAGADPLYADVPTPPPTWTLVAKTADQSATSSTVVNDTDLKFPIAANSIVAFRITPSVATTVTGSFSLTGPASPTKMRWGSSGGGTATAYGNSGVTPNTSALYSLAGLITNGANAGTVTFQFGGGTGGTFTVEKGSFLEYRVIA